MTEEEWAKQERKAHRQKARDHALDYILLAAVGLLALVLIGLGLWLL